MIRQKLLLFAALPLIAAAQVASPASDFAKAIDAAMDRMMAGMHIPDPPRVAAGVKGACAHTVR